MMVIGLSSLSILEVGVRGDAWFHSQNFPLKFLCDYGELANKEVIVGETEWNFRFVKNQYLQTYVADISGGNVTVYLRYVNDEEPEYLVTLYPGGPGYSWKNLTEAGAYLWEFRASETAHVVARATASFPVSALWIGNCWSGPVANYSD